MRPFGIVIAAAGGSSRLGRPKQLVEFEGEPLIRRAVRTALAAGPIEVIVVLGAEADKVKLACRKAVSRDTPSDEACFEQISARAGPAVRFVLNERWKDGMGPSIACGVAAVSQGAEAVVLMLCDQPKITAELLTLLVDSLSPETRIAACSYAGNAGAPCAFDRSIFPELLTLTGDRGARSLIRDHSRPVALIPFEGGKFDIDTAADLTVLSN
jgi:molybdenum cofactor cytidylyltransferase